MFIRYQKIWDSRRSALCERCGYIERKFLRQNAMRRQLACSLRRLYYTDQAERKLTGLPIRLPKLLTSATVMHHDANAHR